MGAPELAVIVLIVAFFVVPAVLAYRDMNRRGQKGYGIACAVLWVVFWPVGLVVWVIGRFRF